MLNPFNPFRRITLRDIQQQEIHITELALHDAKLHEERARANTALLQARLTRLKEEHANQ
jgi:hypothetical protein